MSIKTTKKVNLHTEREITAQPRLWNETYNMLIKEKENIKRFLSPILAHQNLRIILSGAGSSAFIGETAQGIIQKNTNRITQSIATTDLVTHPGSFFIKDIPTLLISFARSGNSPESIETVVLADEYCNNLSHLIITCNKSGELANYSARTSSPCLSIVLPEETNDKSLAMTSSFTTMLLTAILISNIETIENKKANVDAICKEANQILNEQALFREIAKKDFERVVFLGSGEMLGIARECHLKLQELTDGQVICKHDSFLGFRHGPRAVVNANTLVVYLFSNDGHTFKYEKDLAEDIAKDTRKINSLMIGGDSGFITSNAKRMNVDVDLNNPLQVVPTTLVGQLLGLYKCLELGLNPDNPSISGAINRVVQGVNIYKRTKK
ncbi:SIS domain-containing protein [Galbibacter sp. PAP.153]|uniref:SIS domain-containing protein n=1 Tax=Galbibacter sp. PAP.153 TaxID=3104623 RepID=UPI0030099664